MALRRSASNSQLFDAVVGRLILEFLPDPGSLPGLLRPGGLMEFSRRTLGSMAPVDDEFAITAKMRASVIHQMFERAPRPTSTWRRFFSRRFREVGLPAPKMGAEVWVATTRTSMSGPTTSFARCCRACETMSLGAAVLISCRHCQVCLGTGTRSSTTIPGAFNLLQLDDNAITRIDNLEFVQPIFY